MRCTPCVAVWTARNYAVFHAPILVTTKAGEQLYISARGWKEWQFDDSSYRALVAGHSLSDRDRILRRDAIRIIREEPQRYLTQSVARVAEPK